MALSLVPYRCLSSAVRRQIHVHTKLSKPISKSTYGVIKAGDVQSVVDLDTDLFTAYIRWGHVDAVLTKLGSYLEDSKWTHWKIRVHDSVAWPSTPMPPPQQILPFAWAFFYPMHRVIALVHQEPFPPCCYLPMRRVQCALRIFHDPSNIQWQHTRLHIQPVFPPTQHQNQRQNQRQSQRQSQSQNVSVTFYPPVVVWGSHMHDDVQLCMEHWLNDSHDPQTPDAPHAARAPHVMAMRHFSHIIYSYTREPMYIRQYYTPDLLEMHADHKNTCASTNAEPSVQAFFLRKVYIHLDASFQRVVPALYQEDWWSFRNAILSILYSSEHAACVLQRAWRQCIANPSYAMCRKRLCRECHSEKIEAFKV